MAVEHEPNALVPGTELHGSRDGKPAPDPPRRADRIARAPRNGTHGIERRMPLTCEIAPVFRRNCPCLDVGSVRKLHHGSGRSRTGHPSALMGAIDPCEANVVVHHELPGLGSVVGPGTMKLAVVVAVSGDASRVDD